MVCIHTIYHLDGILILTNGEFYAEKRYIHVVQEGAQKYLFDVPVPSVRCARQSVSARVKEERVEVENIATDLPSISSVRRGNLNNDDMNELREYFDVNDDNLPNMENVPEPTPVAINALRVLNWKTDCIVRPRGAENLQN